MPTPIAEEPAGEMVPQFFPGCQPRMSAVVAVAAAGAISGSPAGAPVRLPRGAAAQRRAGSVRLAVDTALAQAEARLDGPRQPLSASAYQSPTEARRSSCQSSSSSATLLSPPPHGSIVPRAASCHFPAMNRYWLPEPAEAAAAALPPIPAAHCPSAIADLRRAPPSVPIAASYSTTTMVHDEPLDAAPGLERRASSTGQSVTRSSSGSSTQTLAAGPTARRGFLKRISLIQRSYHLPHCSKKSLQRNNTTKTVSHNELSEDVDDTCRLLPSRSTDFASALEAPGKPSALVGQCTAVSSKTLVESVYLDCTDVDDIKIAARLLPATHNASAQLAYLPPRTALLTVTNPTSL